MREWFGGIKKRIGKETATQSFMQEGGRRIVPIYLNIKATPRPSQNYTTKLSWTLNATALGKALPTSVMLCCSGFPDTTHTIKSRQPLDYLEPAVVISCIQIREYFRLWEEKSYNKMWIEGKPEDKPKPSPMKNNPKWRKHNVTL